MEDGSSANPSGQNRASVQDVIKKACSITRVSKEFRCSRPSLYKYMGMFDSGDTGKIPEDVLKFLIYVAPGRTKDEVEEYFHYLWVNPPEGQGPSGVANDDITIRGENEAEPPGSTAEEESSDGIEVRILSDSSKAMVIFPALDSDEAVVRLFADFDGFVTQIAEYRPAPGVRFVTVEGLVSGTTFYCEVADPSTGKSSGQVPFVL